MQLQGQNGHYSALDNPTLAAAVGLLPRKLHKLAEARQRQGLSVRCVAQRLGRTVSEVRAQEQEHSNISLADLYRWQAALEVPMQELLHDPEDALSSQVATRARLLKVMKTAQAIQREVHSEGERRLAGQLIEQLLEIMPELKEVSGWPAVGHRRRADDVGRIGENVISESWLYEAG